MELFADYVRAGWYLTPIPTGHKSPVTPGWQKQENGITDPELAAEMPGVGLCHRWSGTCTLDIDDFAAAADWCAMQGLDLNALWTAPDAVKISSGRPNRGKLLFRLPVPLPSKKIIEGDANIIDFRCGTRRDLTVQDVLPPTIHPNTGKPYVWEFDELVTHWSTPPELPAEWRAIWESMISGTMVGDADTPPPSPTGADADVIRQVLALKDPDCDRDAWVKVLSKLHHETQGSEMGLALANEWSTKGKKYDGFDDVRTRWNSFSLDHPAPATMRGDIEGRPATADEFGPPPTPEEQKTEQAATEEQLEVQAEATRKAAAAYLEGRMVYVIELDRYYDTEHNAILAGDHALKHLLTSKMPYVRTPGGGRTRIDPVTVLRNSGKKRVVKAPAFNPAEGLLFTYKGERYINEYQPDGIKAVEPTARQRELLDWLFSRISDEKYRKWLLQFYGHAIQRPGVKILSAPLIWSETTGNGKSALLSDLPRLLFGERYSHSVTTQELEHTHNDYVIAKWFVTMSEMYMGGRADRHKLVNKLKMYITDPLAVHPKGKPAYTTRNNLVITGSSNYEDSAAIDDNDRRWGIHQMRAPRMTEGESAALFDEFLRLPNAEGPVRGYFLGVDITGFVPTSAAPITADRLAMVDANLPEALATLRLAVCDGDGPFQRDLITGSELLDYLKVQGIRSIPSVQWLGRACQKAPLKFLYRQAAHGGRSARLYAVRNQDLWLAATGKDCLDHWRADGDPLTS